VKHSIFCHKAASAASDPLHFALALVSYSSPTAVLGYVCVLSPASSALIVAHNSCFARMLLIYIDTAPLMSFPFAVL
jgi:hypothetical protein